MSELPWLRFFAPIPQSEDEINRLSWVIDGLLLEAKDIAAYLAKMEDIRGNVRMRLTDLQVVRDALQALNNLPQGVSRKSEIVKARIFLESFIGQAEVLFADLPPAVLKKKPRGHPFEIGKLAFLNSCRRLLQDYSMGEISVKDKDIIGLARWGWEKVHGNPTYDDAAWRHTLRTLKPLLTPKQDPNASVI